MADFQDYDDIDQASGLRAMLTDLKDDGSQEMYSVGDKLGSQRFERDTAWEDINLDGIFQETESFRVDHILVSKYLWPCVESVGIEKHENDQTTLLGSHY